MKNKFSLSVISILFYVLAVLASVFLQYRFHGVNSSYDVGRLFGSALGLFVFPAVVALITWYLSGRWQRIADAAFCLCLLFVFSGQISLMVAANSRVQSELIADVTKEKQRLKEAFSNDDSSEGRVAAYDEYTSSIQDKLGRLSDSSRGSEKVFYDVMNAHMAQTQQNAQTWQQAFLAVYDEKILDEAELNSPAAFNDQRRVVQAYIDATVRYRDFYETMLPRLKQKLEDAEANETLSKNALEGARQKHDQQWESFSALMVAHKAGGENMLAILDLLQEHRDSWELTSDGVYFEDEVVGDQYNALYEQLGEIESTVDQLNNELLDTL